MEFKVFKKTILDLASDEKVSLRQIQAFVTRYFKMKHIPHLDSHQSFVVRCSMNDPGEVFRNVSRCSYNPIPKKIKLQRANYPEQQVFYCSMYSDTDNASSSLTCIVETAWEHIERLDEMRNYCTLSRWQCTRPLKLWVLPFSEESCNKNRDFNRIRENMTSLIRKDGRNSEDTILALEFISDCFADRKNKQVSYRITSAFYNSLLFFEKFMSQQYDGVIYPSANTEGAGLNVVLKKELIDTRILYCDVAVMYSITRSPSNLKNLSAFPASNDSTAGTEGKLSFTTIY